VDSGFSHSPFDSVAKHIPGGVFVYSAEEDDSFLFVSENMLAMLGYTKEEFDKKFDGRFSQMVYAEDRENTIKSIREQIAITPFDTCFYRIEKKDGTLISVHDEGHIVIDKQGKRWFYVVIIDITESANASKNLAIQNQELKQLIDRIPVRIVVYKYDKDFFQIVATNGYLNDHTRFKMPVFLNDMSREEIRRFVYAEDLPQAIAFFGRLFSGERSSDELTYRILLNSEEGFIWYHCSAIRMPQEDGSVLIYAVYTDATYQKIREENFNRIIQEVLVRNPNSLFAFRLNLSQNLCSECHGSLAYTRQFLEAKNADEFLGKISSEITDPAEAENFLKAYNREALLQKYQQGIDKISTTYHRFVENGESHWVTTDFHILQNPFTKDIETIAYSVDSDRARKEEIIASITSEEYDFIGLINVATEKIFYYYPLDNAVLKKLMNINYSESLQKVGECFLSAQEKAKFFENFHLQNIIGKLKIMPVYSASYSCLDAAGKFQRKQVRFRYFEKDQSEILFLQSDVTDAFEHEEMYMKQLRKALRSEKKATKMKTDFFGYVSHDMRTPLNAILGYDRLALDSQNVNEIKEYLHKIEIAGSTLLSLVNDSLDLQKIESGFAEIKLQPIACEEVIKEVITSVQPLMDEKKIHFTIDKSRALMSTINADLTVLKKIFINLLFNAAKYTPENGRVDLIIECVKLEKNCLHDRIIIRDNGIGMSKSFQAKLFEPFSQERTKETAHIGGSGLGLSIVKKLVEALNGKIEVKSELGKGSEFIVNLDFERLDDKPAEKEETPKFSGSVSGFHVLLCEDNPMNMEIARKLLEMYGAIVVCASDGAEGLQKFSDSGLFDFDIILMDVRMPNMDGYTAAKKIRKSGHPQAKRIPILAMTADAYASDVENALQSGMNGHISKPLDPEKMIFEMARLVRSKDDAPV